MRRRIRIAAVTVLAALLASGFVGAAGAGAADVGAAGTGATGGDQDTPPVATAVYSVQVTDAWTGPDGAVEQHASSGEIRIGCVGTTCGVISEPAPRVLSAVVLAAGGGTVGGRRADAPVTPVCPDGRGARTISVQADADSLHAELSQDSVDWTDCVDGMQGFAHARSTTWTGQLVAADPCVFSTTGCVTSPESGSASRIGSGTPEAPSVLSALAVPARAVIAPTQLLIAAALAMILALLMAFPTSLLNKAVSTLAGRLTERRARRRLARAPHTEQNQVKQKRAEQNQAKRAKLVRSWSWAAAGVAAAGVISAFVDPQIGANPGSLRVAASLVVSLLLNVVLGWGVVIWLTHRLVPAAVPEFSFRPISLIVVVAAVVFTRWSGFEPGIVFGLVAGVSFAAFVRNPGAVGRVALAAMGYAFVVSMVAWACYSAVGGPSASGQTAWMSFVADTLSALVVSGIVALPLGLVPVQGMPGYAVWTWSRSLWLACYAIGLFAFFVVLMPMPSSWKDVHMQLWVWIAAYAAYAAFAVGAWLLIVRPWVTPAPADEPLPVGTEDRLEA